MYDRSILHCLRQSTQTFKPRCRCWQIWQSIPRCFTWWLCYLQLEDFCLDTTQGSLLGLCLWWRKLMDFFPVIPVNIYIVHYKTKYQSLNPLWHWNNLSKFQSRLMIGSLGSLQLLWEQLLYSLLWEDLLLTGIIQFIMVKLLSPFWSSIIYRISNQIFKIFYLKGICYRIIHFATVLQKRVFELWLHLLDGDVNLQS